jgi:hypothetical protein
MTTNGIGILLINLVIALSATAQSSCTGDELKALVNRIDHVPIVVPDLDGAKNLFSRLQFTLKNGRVHEGVQRMMW